MGDDRRIGMHNRRCTTSSTDEGTMSLQRMQDPHDLAIQNSQCESDHRRGSEENADSCRSEEGLRFSRNLRHKHWIRYQQFESSSEDDSDCVELNKNNRASKRLNKKAAWKPEAACRPMLEEAPVYFPLEEDFKDTLKYIASISDEAEQYGICRIVPPRSWCPPCPLKDNGKRFSTRVQQLEKLQVRKPQVKKFKRKRRRRCKSPYRVGDFCQSRNFACDSSSSDEEKFGFEQGPKLTLEAFEAYANQFKEKYFCIQEQGEDASNKPSVDSIEGEYWRIVEQGAEELEVLYGADIETHKFGSGFPKGKTGALPSTYESTGWNLNNIARLPGSMLAFEEEDISGVLLPWLYIGMCFSSFCWHVEDHHFFSLNYMHFGSPKVWYGVPGRAAQEFENAMKKHLPELFEEQPDLLHKLVTQLSPSILKMSGVPIYRAVQRAGEFVVTFPRAYHAGFNCGFNCAEAVNLAPIGWLPYGQAAVEMYKEQKRKSSVSQDKLLLRAAIQALLSVHEGLSAWQEFLGHDGLLLKVLKNRVDLERVRRDCISSFVHARKMEKNFDAVDARECLICLYDLHLSAIGCECSPKHYACLEHAHELCQCGQARKYALYRYEISELENLVAALEGSSEAMRLVQGVFDLGSLKQLSLTSHLKIVATQSISVVGDVEMHIPLTEKRHMLLASTHKLQSCQELLPKRNSEVIVVSDDEDDVADSVCSLTMKKEIFDIFSTPVGSQTVNSRVEPRCVARSLTFGDANDSKCQQSSHLHDMPHKVHLLNLGRLVSRKPWFNKHIIFPSGFRSRVAFPSILDPMKQCFYVSEVLEDDHGDPLFKVAMENYPNETFIHSSIHRCWQMVQERVSITLRLWYTDGEPLSTSPQLLQEVDGFELFGFTSPDILKAIKSLDRHYQCVDFWSEKLHHIAWS